MTYGHVCGFCNKRVIANSATIEGDEPNQTLQLQAPSLGLKQNDRLTLITAFTIPSGAGTIPVTVQFGNNNPIPIQTRTGNVMRADQLSSRKAYRVVYGDDPSHLTLECYIKKSAGETPQAPQGVL